MRRILFLGLWIGCYSQLPAQSPRLPADAAYRVGKLLFKEDFAKDLSHWVPETPPDPRSKIGIRAGALVVDVAKGATLWLRTPLKGNVLITYRRQVITEGDVNDRLSDLNQFWMATDPRRDKLFTRTGVFSQYDSLSMYYVGFGGNYNTTTRLRKYTGTGERVLLKEYRDPAHLLRPNHWYRIAITVYNGRTEFFVDGEKWFSYRDPRPLREGYFGFRATWTRQAIDDVRIYRLEAKKEAP